MTRIDIAMPQLGQSVSEGTVVKWLKKPGETVARDEGVVAISTDKAEAEVPAPAAGRLTEVLVPEGTTVDCGTVLGRMDSGVEAGATRGSAAAPATGAARDVGRTTPSTGPQAAPAREPRHAPSLPPHGAARAAAPISTPTSTPIPRPVPTPVASPPEPERALGFLSPAVRTLLRERGLPGDFTRHVTGTGRGGRVTLEDLASHLEREAAGEAMAPVGTRPAEPAAPGRAASDAASDVEIVAMTGMRARIAEHMLAAKRNIPHVNTVAEIDMSGVVAARRAHGPAFEQSHGFGLSFNAFLLKAVAASLLDFPAVNAVLDARGIVMHRRVHLGMAVALEPSGLVVPVVRDAHAMTVRQLAVEAQRLADRARKRQLLPDEMEGGTCTVTNPGVFGNLFGTPIIHAPQAAMVDFGAIQKRVVALSDEDGDVIAIRPMCYVVLAWDHRVMDGATAARFLQRLVQGLEAVDPKVGID